MVKGFKDKDKKFIPTEPHTTKGDPDASPGNSDGSNGMVRDDLVPESGSKNTLPEYQSEAWNKIQKDVENRMAHDFNEVQLTNLEKTNSSYFENIITTEPTEQQIDDYLGEKGDPESSEYDDAREEIRNKQMEIMWGTIFEAKDSMLADKIIEHQDAIINDLGLRIIDERDNEAYSNGLFLGVNGAGYDFYHNHWVPLYRLFGWV